MDAVITYVDGNDPLWQKAYAETVGVETFLEKRFRDWGTLKYLLRGVEKCMPFVENVHLVVASDSQVPQWVDRSKLHIVRHKDIIPERFLPVFNSGSIEMFLHRIPGLSGRFIYFNDDFFPVLPFTEKDFFPEGKPAVHMARHCLTLGHDFRIRVRLCSNMAKVAAGGKASRIYCRPQHTAAPMLREVNEELFDKCKDDILGRIPKLRSTTNYSQYIYTDYMYYKGVTADRKISNRHFSLAVAGIDKIVAFLDKPDRKMVCINDVRLPAEKFELYRSEMLSAFDRRFPGTSRFEL